MGNVGTSVQIMQENTSFSRKIYTTDIDLLRPGPVKAK